MLPQREAIRRGGGARRFQRDDETLMRTVDDLKGTHAAVNREHAARKRTVDALQKTVNELKRKT
jgi:hypothetical protein